MTGLRLPGVFVVAPLHVLLSLFYSQAAGVSAQFRLSICLSPRVFGLSSGEGKCTGGAKRGPPAEQPARQETLTVVTPPLLPAILMQMSMIKISKPRLRARHKAIDVAKAQKQARTGNSHNVYVARHCVFLIRRSGRVVKAADLSILPTKSFKLCYSNVHAFEPHLRHHLFALLPPVSGEARSL